MIADPPPNKSTHKRSRRPIGLFVAPLIVVLLVSFWTAYQWNYGIGGYYYLPAENDLVRVRDFGLGWHQVRVFSADVIQNNTRDLRLEKLSGDRYRLFESAGSLEVPNLWKDLGELTRRDNNIFEYEIATDDTTQTVTYLIPLSNEQSATAIDQLLKKKLDDATFLSEFEKHALSEVQMSLLELFRTDFYIQQEDTNRVAEQIAKLREFDESLNLDVLEKGIGFYEKWLFAMGKTRDGLNYSEKVNEWLSTSGQSFDIEEFSTLIGSMKNEAVIMRIDGLFLLGNSSSYNYELLQTMTSLFRAFSDFALFAGDPFEALSLTLRPLTIGILLKRDSTDSVSIKVGTSMTNNSADSLENVLLSGFRTPAQFEFVWPVVKNIYQMDLAATQAQSNFVSSYHNQWGDSSSMNGRQRITKHSHAKIANIISASAAHQQLLTKPDWKPSSSDFGYLLPNGPYPDPFTNFKKPLSVVQTGEIRWRVYSIGPDETDDKALITYDPTNGSVSPGDIWTTIRRDRKYPFPSPHGLPLDRNAIVRLFPEGLPPDPFATEPGASYTVTDHKPAWIMSWGPDRDQTNVIGGRVTSSITGPVARGRAISTNQDSLVVYKPFDLEAHYDPTNGTLSDGDLYITSGYPDEDYLQGPLPATPTPLPVVADRNR